MKWKNILYGCLIIFILTTGLFIGMNRQPKYSIAQAAAITAAKTATTTRPVVKKKKPCSCCEMRLERVKKMIQRARERRNAQSN